MHYLYNEAYETQSDCNQKKFVITRPITNWYIYTRRGGNMRYNVESQEVKVENGSTTMFDAIK